MRWEKHVIEESCVVNSKMKECTGNLILFTDGNEIRQGKYVNHQHSMSHNRDEKEWDGMDGSDLKEKTELSEIEVY